MATTVPSVLAQQVRADGARPLVTFYDDASGERVELSATTFANWVAKTASLIQDELDVERGRLVLLDLPTHWIGTVWLAAAWAVGLRATDDQARADAADLVVCGPDGVGRYAALAARLPVVATSLRPLGGRFPEPLPGGMVDYGAVVLGQPDVFLPLDPPADGDPAWVGSDGEASHGDLLAAAPGESGAEPGGRLLTDVPATSRLGASLLLGPLLAGGGTVWVRNADPDGWQARALTERAAVVVRRG